MTRNPDSLGILAVLIPAVLIPAILIPAIVIPVILIPAIVLAAIVLPMHLISALLPPIPENLPTALQILSNGIASIVIPVVISSIILALVIVA
jgi:hypothetical protein